MQQFVSPRQVARAIGVSESSLKRWCDRGLLKTVRTAGGHRRVPVNSVIDFLRQTGQTLVSPEVLGLPATTGKSLNCIERSSLLLAGALSDGDESLCRQIVFDLYLARHTACDIFDKVISAAFHLIGERWRHGEIEIYQERRGCEICLRVLYELRSALPAVSAGAPQAIGATLPGDPYTLPTTMAEITLREAGWQAQCFGNELPVATLCAAIHAIRPRLFWLSVSVIPSTADFVAGFSLLHQAAAANGTAVIVGGRALTDDVRRQVDYCAYCDAFRHVASFASTLYRWPQANQPARSPAAADTDDLDTITGTA